LAAMDVEAMAAAANPNTPTNPNDIGGRRAGTGGSTSDRTSGRTSGGTTVFFSIAWQRTTALLYFSHFCSGSIDPRIATPSTTGWRRLWVA
jgi:hypothetical protein